MPKYCGYCGNEISEMAYVCPKCGVVVNDNSTGNVTNIVDNGGFGWGILGFFFPVVGLILYLVWKNTKPKSAKSVGKGALISVIVNVVVYVVIMIILGIVFNVMASNL